MTLLAHWPLDETGATFADVSGRGHDGSFNGLGSGDLTKGVTVGGRTGCYFHIMGNGDTCPTVPGDAELGLPGSFTVEAYVHFPADRIATYGHAGVFWNYPGLVSVGSNHDTAGDWLFYYTEPGFSQEPLGIADLQIPKGKKLGETLGDGVTVEEDRWYRARWTYDADTGRWRYVVDGVEVASVIGPDGGLGASSGLVRFGSNPNYGYHEKARAILSDVKVWDEVIIESGGWSVGVIR